ncbi:unnamed protein product [Cuscuta europaea]|uniref:Uncharacterized protein n=1 Tax=Cuscuta europaea TaxID=41803 RepID=A0A9P0YKB7_CUSEU|nr:unnamed protein product [Cuscuta europaea]
MGRGRGKGKKQPVREDLGSGEEEKMPPVRRRGRPQKPLKDDIEDEIEEEAEKVEGGEENDKAGENGKKRKRDSQATENGDLGKEENGVGDKSNPDDLIKPVGFRQIGSRRKNKPRRAAAVGVECR